MYYNNQKGEYLALKESIITDEYVNANNKRADDILSVSNSILVYDLIKNAESESSQVDESKMVGGNNEKK